MAYIVSVTNSYVAAAASSGAISFPTHVAGDLLLCCLTQDGGTSAITTASTGWAMLGTGAASGGCRQQWAWKLATSTTGEDPTFSGTNDDWICSALVVRDAHATTPFGASPASGTDFVRTDWNAVGSSASGSLTTAVDDCLLLYSWGMDTDNGANIVMRLPPDTVTTLTNYAYPVSPNAITQVIGYVQTGPAAAAPAVTMYDNDATQGGNGWVIAIRNKSGGVKQPCCSSSVAPLKWYGNFGSAYETLTYNAPNAITATINSISTSSAAATRNHLVSDAVNIPGTCTQLASAENTAGLWVGVSHAIPATDLTGKMFSLSWRVGSLSGNMGAEGWIVVFSDGTNWIAYQLGKPALAITIDAWNYSSIALGAATAYASSGTMDWASVTKSIGIFWHRNGSTTTSRTMDIKNAMIFGAAKLIGGGLGNAVKPKYLPLALDAAVIRDISRRQGGSQVLVKGGLQIGDGSTPTYFDLSASSVEYPLAYSASDYSLSNWNANASSSGVTIYASANDAIYCSAGVLATTIAQPFTIHASSSLSATYSFLGASFVGWDVTDNAGLAWNGATFSGGGIATIAGGGDLTNCSISKTTSTNAALAITANGSVLTSTTITVADTSVATDYHLELGTAVTAISLVDVTFSGTAASAGNNKVHVLKTTGTVTITISGTTSLASGDVTSAGATVVIAAPELYQSVPITGLSTTCRVQLYDTSAATELYNGEPGATTYTWTDASPAVSARPIRLRITDYLGSTAKSMIEANIGTCGVTEGTETVSYNAELAQDTSYNAMASALGYTGADVTDIQIEDATDTVKFNYLAGGDYDARRIYMYMVYWLDTEAGIRDDFVFCDPPDSANLPMQAVQFKNVTSPSETITFVNAYVYDAATGRAADLIDTTGGNICFAPDHVVVTTVSTSDAVISGTAAEIIAAIPSAADNADAVLDDGRALTVGKFVALKSL